MKRRRMNAKQRAQVIELARRCQWKGKTYRKAVRFLRAKIRAKIRAAKVA